MSRQATPPEPLTAKALDPLKESIRRLRDDVLPLLERGSSTQRKATVKALESDLRDAFKVIDNLEGETRELRVTCRALFQAVRKHRRKTSRPVLTAPRRSPEPVPTEAQKSAVLVALKKIGRPAAMSDLVFVTSFGQSKMNRIIKALREEGKIERSGSGAGTRYTALPQSKGNLK
jgi:hypothetical protein